METNVVEDGLGFVCDLETGRWSMTELCERYGITQPMGSRFETHGRDGLLDHSRAPPPVRTRRRYPDRAGWTQPYRRWLADLSFPLAPQHIALQECRDTICETERRVERLTDQLRLHTPAWRWAPVVDALQALRGVSFVTAVSLVAEIGDIRRFTHPRQLMAFLGLVPSEYSSGPSVRRGGITKAGNPRAARARRSGVGLSRDPAHRPADALSTRDAAEGDL